jgi:hypothetical protein
MGILNSFIPKIASIRLTRIMACFFERIPFISTLDPSASIFTDSSSISISNYIAPEFPCCGKSLPTKLIRS